MTLEDPQAIDTIETSEQGKVCLVIIDGGQTTEASARLAALLSKLRTYINFALSDEFAAKYPGVDLSSVSIRVDCAQPPTDEMVQIHQVGPEGDRQRVIPVEFTHQGTAIQPAPRKPSRKPFTTEFDQKVKLTPALLKKLYLVMAAIWIVAAGVFIAWLNDVYESRRLESEGVVVSGEVLGAHILEPAYGKNTYRLPVRFVATDSQDRLREIEKTFFIKEPTYEKARLAGVIDVKYLPDDVNVSHIVGYTEAPITNLVTATELAAVAAIMWLVLWRLGKKLRANEEQQPAEATRATALA